MITNPHRPIPRARATDRQLPLGLSRVRRRVLMYTLALAAAGASVAALDTGPASAQSASDAIGLPGAALDSVKIALTSEDWNERHGALVRLNRAYPDALPNALVPSILALLARESTASDDHAGDEEFGEYVVDLVLTGVRTGDARAVPAILKLDGLGISSGVAGFVAAQGRAVMPALDALAPTREDRASDVAETYALMYARHGSSLARADSAHVLRRLLDAAAHPSPAVRAHLAYVASQGAITELLPVLAELASSDPDQLDGVYVVRRDATDAVPTLQHARAALTTGELLNRLTLLTAAACGDADARLQGQCTALAAHLATAGRHLAAGESLPAGNALDAYRRTVQRLAEDGLLKRLTTVTLDGAARAVGDRL